ncbi:ThiF family adenylyltransferase [Nitrospira sp. Nam74]
MSQQRINRSPDLKRLRDEGYDVQLKAGFLLLGNVPYVTAARQIKRGILVSELTLAGDVTTTPGTHVAYFAGEYPCNKDGSELGKMRHNSGPQQLAEGLVVQHSFSAKPLSGGYTDYYDKMTTYAAILSGPAEAIDPDVKAQTFPVIRSEEGESVFNYIDTASSRAGINMVTMKLELRKIAIVGLGGTGSYVLDFVAKTPVGEIHLFDGDTFLQHNAFRSPGAPSIEELQQAQKKVMYFRDRYATMRRGIMAHEYHIDASTAEELRDMDFVFLCIDGGGVKRLIIEKLEEFGIGFVDVGMGVELVDGSLGGILRVTTSTAKQRGHVQKRVSSTEGDINDNYSRNIQIADLNALNAALAVIKWKKLSGFYLDLENEHNSTYTIDGNIITNDDRP